MALTLRFQTTGRVPGNARPVEMRGQSLTVGRSPDNDLVLPDPDRTISKRHCVLEERAGLFVVIDISSNGTFLNYGKEPLGPESQPVNDGDILSIGPYELIVGIVQGASAVPEMAPPPPMPAPHMPEMPDAMPSDSAGDLLDDLLGGTDGGGGSDMASGMPLIPDDADDDLLGGLPGFEPEPPRAAPAAYTPPSQGDVAGRSFTPAAPAGSLIPDDWDLEIGGATENPDEARPSGGPFGAPAAPPVTPPATPPVTPPVSAPVSSPASPPAEPRPEPRADALAPPLPEPIAQPTVPPMAPPAGAVETQPFGPTGSPFAGRPAGPAPMPVAEGQGTPLPHAADAPRPNAEAHPAEAAIPSSEAPTEAPWEAPTVPPSGPAAPAPSDAARAFLAALGVSDVPIADDDLEAVMARLGTTMRALIVGVREILMTRSAIKGEFRMGQTVIRRSGNNPLKFSVTEDEAVERLARPPAKGYMDPDAAVEEALRDIRAHEIAMVSGMQAALSGLLAQFDPEVLSAKLAESGRSGGLLKSKKTQYWEVFEETYASISDQAENEFHELFTREFAQAYQSQLEKLK